MHVYTNADYLLSSYFHSSLEVDLNKLLVKGTSYLHLIICRKNNMHNINERLINISEGKILNESTDYKQHVFVPVNMYIGGCP